MEHGVGCPDARLRLRPMRNSALAAAAGLLLATGLSACGVAKTTTVADTGCQPGDVPTVTDGFLTIATDSPAYDPWFSDNDPSNGKGFESAVAYAIAKQMGYDASKVKWVKESFNNSYTPGKKDFDFDLNQISITPDRAKVVDFSTGYYSTTQAVVALKGSAAASDSTLAGLKDLKLGAQTATTSLTAIRNDVKPTQTPMVYGTNDAAVQGLKNKQIDGLVVDLPTAFYLQAVELENSVIVGQFVPSGDAEEFGALLQKDSPLTKCVSDAVDALKTSGELANIENEWLSTEVKVPFLK